MNDTDALPPLPNPDPTGTTGDAINGWEPAWSEAQVIEYARAARAPLLAEIEQLKKNRSHLERMLQWEIKRAAKAERERDALKAEIERLQEQIETQIGAINRSWQRAQWLESERDALKADAERYRWLRMQTANGNDGIQPGIAALGWVDGLEEFVMFGDPGDVDAAIDAAMNGKE